MNPKETLRLLIWSQLFCLVALVLTPTLVRWLPEFSGKIMYAMEVAVAVSLAALLRRALNTLDRS